MSGEFKLVGIAKVRKALNNGALVNQSIPNGHYTSPAFPYEPVTFNQVLQDTLGVFDPIDSSFKIPAGVDYAEFFVQGVWVGNSNGPRQWVILRKSPRNVDPTKFWFYDGSAVMNQTAISGTTTDHQGRSVGLDDVVLDEKYAPFPMQMSGAPLELQGGTGTVFAAKFYKFVPAQ